MNYPYSSFLLESRAAKQRLARVFLPRSTQRGQSLTLWNDEGVSARNEQRHSAKRPSVLPELARTRAGVGVGELRRNAKDPGRPYWMREDMGTHSFAWTLLLLSAVAAAQTDQPVLWLLIGPVPFVVGFAATAFIQRRLKLGALQSRRYAHARARRYFVLRDLSLIFRPDN